MKIAPVPTVTDVIILIFVFCVSTMPCKDGEEAMNARDEEPPCTPPRPTDNGGAGHSESDAQMDSENDSDELQQDGDFLRRGSGTAGGNLR